MSSMSSDADVRVAGAGSAGLSVPAEPIGVPSTGRAPPPAGRPPQRRPPRGFPVPGRVLPGPGRFRAAAGRGSIGTA